MKKNLIILLFIPFLLALLGVVTINTTYQIVDNDIVGIKWDYSDIEVFAIDNEYPLMASGINEKNYPLGSGNNLVWKVTNKDKNDQNVYGKIEVRNGYSYFIPLLEGECIVTCSNEKGNVFKSMTVVVYEKGTSVLTIRDVNKPSQSNIDVNTYVGEYDLVDHNKEQAVINFVVSETPINENRELIIEDKSDNIEVDLVNNKILIKDSGDAYLKISSVNGKLSTKGVRYNFKVIENGVNVYTYDDLLDCTNRSKDGEIVVLRKSFESLDYLSEYQDETTVLFGNFNQSTKKFNFNNEVYRFKTTYNSEYIRQWNQYIKDKNGSNFIDDKIVCGLRVQKDFYGNGYSINMHNLTYPKEYLEQSVNGQIIRIPITGKDDLFKGPLPFYALGDHNNMPLVEAFGQDNIGMYVDGDNITINDVNLRNCDFGNMIANLNTVGTVLEVNGNNVTIKNSILKNGKNIVRSFSSLDCVIDNCMISSSRNFLVCLGTNEYIPIDEMRNFSFNDLNNNIQNTTIKEYLKNGGSGDDVLNQFIMGTFENKNAMAKALNSIQKALNDESLVKDIYKGSIEIKDTLFYQSGIAAISFESMFNGPFLYNSVPSAVDSVLKLLQTNDGTSLSELQFKDIAGMSYPVSLKLTGDTKFYDYKNINNLDITGLITENISNFAASIKPDYEGQINIDKIFPIKVYLAEEAKKENLLYLNSYINIPIAYYGGGVNLSTVDISILNHKEHFAESVEVNFLDNYLDLKETTDTIGMMKNIMLKAVTVVTGTEPFKFVCYKADGYLYKETPQVTELIERAKGVND